MQNPINHIPSLQVKTITAGKKELKCLEGAVSLSAWQGFQSRRGPYNSVDRNEPSDGNVKLTVGEYAASDETLAVMEEQVNAYRFTLERQEQIRESILNALLPLYNGWRQEYGYEDGDERMPNITHPSQFKSLMGVSIVHVLDVSKEGVAYVGYEFGCTWDDEHGLGVMTHKDRVIEIGGADSSFESWIAEKDLDPTRSEEEPEIAKTFPVPHYKKPWWKFW